MASNLEIRFTSSLSLGRPMYLAFQYEVYETLTGRVVDTGSIGTVVKNLTHMDDSDEGLRHILADKLRLAQRMHTPVMLIGDKKRSLGEIAERLLAWSFADKGDGRLALSHPVAGDHEVVAANTFQGRIGAVLEVAPEPIEWPEPDPEPEGSAGLAEPVLASVEAPMVPEAEPEAVADLPRWKRLVAFVQERSLT